MMSLMSAYDVINVSYACECLLAGSCSKQQQRMLQDDFDDYTGYR
jgi:hypothetical protein